MNTQRAIDDLEYVRNVAEQGVNTPLVGGRIGLLWGILLSTTFAIHGSMVAGLIPFSSYAAFSLWLGFAVFGGVGTFLLDRRLGNKPGAASVANQVDNAVWFFFSMAMLACFVGLTLSVFLRGAGQPVFDTMVAFGFAGQGMAYGTLTKVTGQRWMLLPSLAAFAMAVVCFTAIGTSWLYLVAAAGIVLTVVLPSLINIRREPADVS